MTQLDLLAGDARAASSHSSPVAKEIARLNAAAVRVLERLKQGHYE